MWRFPLKSNHSLKPLGKKPLDNWVEFFIALVFSGRKKPYILYYFEGEKEVTLEFPTFLCYLVPPNTSISSVSAAWYPCVQCTGHTHTHACTDTLYTLTRISHVPPGSSDKDSSPARASGWDPGHLGASGSRTPGGYDSEGGGHQSASLWCTAAAHRQKEWPAGGGGRWQSCRVISNRRRRASGGSVAHTWHGRNRLSFLAGTSCTVPSLKVLKLKVCMQGTYGRCSRKPNRWYHLYAALIIEKIRSGPCTATTLMSEGTCSPICYLLV